MASIKIKSLQKLPLVRRDWNAVILFKGVGVTHYAATNADEFAAEAFKEYKLRKNPSKYAAKVGALIDKYFKR